MVYMYTVYRLCGPPPVSSNFFTLNSLLDSLAQGELNLFLSRDFQNLQHY